ncbi:MAG: heme lyase CcmF/NrfE family subunit [Gammaproteobacteria bacterium]|nr:heme lyase CcmF/NrfE family subunit [Gammaproteobacteria bacterium]
MIPELGHFFLILALVNAVILGTLPFYGAHVQHNGLMRLAPKASIGQFILLLASYICLTIAFVQDDFSVAYVANHSNTLLPLRYKITAVWGSHEGSLLLWILILSGWMAAVAIFSKALTSVMRTRVLATLGLISVGFVSFALFTSNPFERVLPFIPIDGADLNPLLQDFGMIVHPPMLYMGFVGFSVVFAFAIAGLLQGDLDQKWAKWARPWTTVAWIFLTVGIALGSWWAYYELGWGGWWFWDPVENASFMPWLVGTALLHSLAATEKRGAYKSWTVLLAILTFSLSLLGTFLVRSGVLTSVHAFATDPERGLFILTFLGLAVGGALTLYAWQFDKLKSNNNYTLVSKEIAIVLNNVLLFCSLLVVFLGTLYPLIADYLWQEKVSIGPPFFDPYFSFFFAFILFLIPFGQQMNWKQNKLKTLAIQQLELFLLSMVIAFVSIYGLADKIEWFALLGISLGLWLMLSCLFYLYGQTKNAKSLFTGLKKITRSYWGMIVAHIGVAVTVIGVIVTTFYSLEKDVRIAPQETVAVQNLEIEFVKFDNFTFENYISSQATLKVSKNGESLAVLKPEKRRYRVSNQLMTEAAINPGFFSDLYISLAQPLENGAWAIKVYYKPFVRWIWLGALLMALGGLLAVSDKRYREKKFKQRAKTKEVNAQ